jgi:outer membrane protein TolC
MRASCFRILFILCVGLTAPWARAQIQELSLSSALQKSTANPVKVAGENAAIRLANANREASPTFFDAQPEIRLTQVDRWSGGNEQEYSLRLKTQNPWILKSEKKAHDHRVQMAKEHLDVRKWQIQHQAKLFYFQALLTQREYDLAKEWQIALQENLKWHESLLESGQQTLSEILEVRIDTNKAIRDTRKAQLIHQKAVNQLLSWINLSPTSKSSETIRLTTGFASEDHNSEKLDATQIYKTYSTKHPLPNSMLQLGNIAQAQVESVDAGHMPWISFLQAGVTQSSNTWEEEDWRFRVGIEVPLFNRQNKLADAAKAQQDFVQSQLEAHLNESRFQIQEKVANVEFATRHLGLTKSLTREIIEQLTANLEEDQQTPTFSPETRFRLQRGLHRMKESLLEAEFALQQAVLELDYFRPLSED